MRRRITAVLVMAVICLLAVAPALAAGTFLFTEKSATLKEGETFQTTLRRSGVYDGEAEIKYSSSKPEIASISEDGLITAVSKGETKVYASLIRKGKRVGRCEMTVKVIRPVTKVTLNTAGLKVLDLSDPATDDVLISATDYPVIALAAGASVNLSAVCTPEDASSTKVTFTTSDAGVAKISKNKTLKGVQHGQCELTLTSDTNPEVQETWTVVVTQPVKTILVSAESRTVASGETVQLTAECQPANASIKDVRWVSNNPQIAAVDEDGTVTGLKRGSAVISAIAEDGSGAKGSITISVIQPVTGLTITPGLIEVTTGKSVQARTTAQPADASDKSVTWYSSDNSIATAANGRITGVKAGTCTVTCASNTNPEITASATVIVSQLVKKIEFTTPKEYLSIRVGEQTQLQWAIEPDDATETGVTFKSAHPKIATVDENGVATGVGRGTATIYVTAQDATKKRAATKVTVIQPVTGVEMQQPLYYVQQGWDGYIRAVVQPRNANNQKVYWSSTDDGIASVRSNGTSTGSIQGYRTGRTTITAYTEDGGFTATADVRVGNFNEAVMAEGLEVNAQNQIKIILRNMSDDITMQNIYYTVECYDLYGQPMICNTDGVSTSFNGYYPFEVLPRERTVHGCFRFQDYTVNQQLGMVVLTVTGWKDTDGVSWTIQESERVPRQWVSTEMYSLYPGANSGPGSGGPGSWSEGPGAGTSTGPSGRTSNGQSSGSIFGPGTWAGDGPSSETSYGPNSGTSYGPGSGTSYGPSSGSIFGYGFRTNSGPGYYSGE